MTKDDDILRRLIADDQITGGYAIGNVQAYQGKAQVMVEFAKRCDAMSSGEIAARTADCAARLGSLCRKVIAHYDTNHGRLAKFEAFLIAYDAFIQRLDGAEFEALSDEEGTAIRDRLQESREALR